MYFRIAIVFFLLVGALVSPPLLAADAPSNASVKRAAPVTLGDAAPDFTLEDQDGRKVSLAAEWKMRPVVLIFYRGNW